MAKVADFPSYDDMQVVLLSYLAENGPCVPKDVYGPLADRFRLTPAQRIAPRRDSGEGSLWKNRVQWTRQRMKNRGLLGPKLRIWELSASGLKAARQR